MFEGLSVVADDFGCFFLQSRHVDEMDRVARFDQDGYQGQCAVAGELFAFDIDVEDGFGV